MSDDNQVDGRFASTRLSSEITSWHSSASGDGQRVRIRAPNALSSKSYLVASLEARHKKLQTPPGCRLFKCYELNLRLISEAGLRFPYPAAGITGLALQATSFQPACSFGQQCPGQGGRGGSVEYQVGAHGGHIQLDRPLRFAFAIGAAAHRLLPGGEHTGKDQAPAAKQLLGGGGDQAHTQQPLQILFKPQPDAVLLLLAQWLRLLHLALPQRAAP